ncbi:hypothetical protein BH23BAC3_BH23BAC3_24780 [soil metagenome]
MFTTMKNYIGLFCISLVFIISACSNPTSNEGDITDSLDPVENVTPITGAENTTMNVNRGPDSYFVLGFHSVQSNDVIADGMVGEGWCIDWEKPIESNDGSYSNIPLYSTFNVESWNPLNYLLNIKEDLMNSDPELTYREIQLVVWSLRGHPEFNLEEIALENLPSRMRTDGEPNFSYEKVNSILEMVETGYRDFEFTEGTKYSVIAETPADVQTVITVVE